MRLADIRHWVFDMDGTLTRAVHDFPAIRRALDIPEQDDILLHLAALPEAEAAAKHAWLLEHERALAEAARPAPGALELVRELQRRSVRLGILTRNDHQLALITLEAIGLGGCLLYLFIGFYRLPNEKTIGSLCRSFINGRFPL